MKRRIATVSILSICFALLLGVLEVRADLPWEYPEGGFPCGTMPTDPPVREKGCPTPANSCTPLDPPPTQWYEFCCRETTTHCTQVYYRHQCCRSGSTYFWGFAFREDPAEVGTCVHDKCVS